MAEEQRTDNGPGGQPVGLSTATSFTDGIRVVALSGEIDYHTGGRLRQALDVTGTVLPRIAIDLSQVTFMDSVGINLLIATHQNAAAAGGWLRLAAPTDTVLRVLQLVGLDQFIDCQPTLKQALTT
ncbi:STAS domain-containing protein [Streptomyces sp. NPDC048594]|uniref:STAS domain-containing protein n=1 Tax=Streptomyces sp. NPDC048594 TaxID=3365575 RepID=UPI0037223935